MLIEESGGRGWDSPPAQRLMKCTGGKSDPSIWKTLLPGTTLLETSFLFGPLVRLDKEEEESLVRERELLL